MKKNKSKTETIESLIEETNKKGYILNNLFQLGSGNWRANFRHEGNYSGCAFGDGVTPVQAIENAIVDLQKIPAPKTQDKKTKEKFPEMFPVKKKRVRL